MIWGASTDSKPHTALLVIVVGLIALYMWQKSKGGG